VRDFTQQAKRAAEDARRETAHPLPIKSLALWPGDTVTLLREAKVATPGAYSIRVQLHKKLVVGLLLPPARLLVHTVQVNCAAQTIDLQSTRAHRYSSSSDTPLQIETYEEGQRLTEHSRLNVEQAEQALLKMACGVLHTPSGLSTQTASAETSPNAFAETRSVAHSTGTGGEAGVQVVAKKL